MSNWTITIPSHHSCISWIYTSNFGCNSPVCSACIIFFKKWTGVAAKIVYDAIEKIKTKSKDEPINIFNEAINNIKPTVEVRSRRVGGATYQVPVEVKSKRAQALAIRWLVDSARKRKDKHMSDKIFNELFDAYEKKGAAVKKREDVHKMAESNKAFAHFRW